MKLGVVAVIARKEFMDALRDRRTLLCMMLLPLLLMPLLVVFGGRFLADTMRENEERVLDVAVDDWGQAALRELAEAWRDENAAALLAVQGRLGLDAAGGLEGLLAAVGQARGTATPAVADAPDDEADPHDPDGAAAGARDAASVALSALEGLGEDERRLLDDARAIDAFLSRTHFVALDTLSGGGDLARGVRIPEGLPAPLARPAVTFALQQKTIAAAIFVPRDVVSISDVEREVDPISGATRLVTSPTVALHVVYDGSQPLSEKAYERFADFVAALDRSALRARLLESRLDDEFARPAEVSAGNVATASRQFQGHIGGILPYMLFSFCFFGALYPALDITAGEKERFTLETLLLGPVARSEIALGKFLVVFLAGIIAALLSTASMVASITYGLLPAAVLDTLDLHFEPGALLLTASLVIPIAAMYAALLLAVGLYARSFKEAQSYTVPLQLLLLIPMLVSFVPDLETKGGMAWIPFVNVAMLLREVFKGETPWDFYAITLASTLLLTGLSLFAAARMFRREEVLLRA